jgi:arylformamidase
MLPLAPLFSIYRAGHEQLCLCGDLAVAGADGEVLSRGDGRSPSLARALLDPILMVATDEAVSARAERSGNPAAAGWMSAEAALRARLAALFGADPGFACSIEIVTDIDGLAAPLLDVRDAAASYRALAAAPPGSPLGAAREALLARPDRLSDDGDVAARLMQVNPGRLLARLGSAGWLAVAVPLGEARGAGIAVKLASGDQPEWAALAVRPFLEELGLEALPIPSSAPDVRWHVHPARPRSAPLDISPMLSERIAVWPGDTPFRRNSSIEPGSPGANGAPTWQLVVSSVQTTLHAGAHADAPNHVGLESAGIDQVPLETYRGLCQVIRVAAPKGTELTPRDLDERPPLAPRVLFATGSYRTPERFDPGFSALSPALIDWLQRHGVVLVGIDTPSVDLFSSTELSTHRATRRGRGVAILEGLVLEGIDAGLYELVALPLRIEGADASPVRASLWPLR